MNAIRQLLFEVVRKAIDQSEKVAHWSYFQETYDKLFLESSMVRGRNPFSLTAPEIQKILANGGNR